MIDTIIFDFDGVILESMSVKSEAFAKIYEPYGEDIVAKVVQHHQANGGLSRYKKFEYYHKNFLQKELSEVEKQEFDRQFSEYVMQKIKEVPFVKGVKEFLEQNYMQYKMFVSTGAPEYEVKEVVKLRGLEKYFVEVFGSPQTKVGHINNILTKYNLHPSSVVFIGDGAKDKESAEATHLHFIARISSAQSPLKDEKYQIKDFTEIEDVLKRISISNLIA